VRYKGNIISVPTEEMGALLCFYIFKHSDLKANMKIKHKLKINKQDRQISAIRCIKGIGKSLAIELLKRYSISKISSIKDYKKFMEIDGIGEKKAKDIVLFFHNSLD
jgi:ERCC4-type nuclease